MSRTYRDYTWANFNSRRINRGGLKATMIYVDSLYDLGISPRPRDTQMAKSKSYLSHNEDAHVSAYQNWIQERIYETEFHPHEKYFPAYRAELAKQLAHQKAKGSHGI
jgi:hypothetical protein